MTPRNPHLIFILILCLLAGGAARAQTPATAGGQPPARPILCIEAGMHTGKIGRIDVDRAGRYLVTGSADKTVRVWSLADGSLLRIIRPPIGDGVEGSVYSVAISPDGNKIACGGMSDFAHKGVTDIYLFDRASGVMLRRISDLPEIAEDISFSPDGKYLAAGLLGASGVGIFSTKDGDLARVDAEYGDSCYGLDWDNSGRLVTSCWDGFLRLYSAAPALKLIAKVKAPDGVKPHGIRFSPDGSRIAVGYVDSNAVTVLAGADMSLLYRPTVAGIGTSDDDLSTVCWSSDGKTLFAGGKASDPTNHHFIRAWTQGGKPGGNYRDTAVSRATIFGLRALPVGGAAASGALVYTSAEPQWGVLDGDCAKTDIGDSAPTADYRRIIDGFRISDDGTKIDFAFEEFGKSPARLDVTERIVDVGGDKAKQDTGANSAKMTAPVVHASDLKFDVIDTQHLTVNGIALALDRYDRVIGGLAIAPDQKSFLVGSSFNLNCFGADGKVRWKSPVASALWGVNVAGSGAVAIAASSDGTIRWYRMRDGKELLDFFPHADRKRWVLWTPDGYYDCSPGGEDLIGWNVNRGKDQAADFYPASRFRGTYYRPDVIQQVLKSLDPAEALRIANLNAGRTSPAAPANVETHLPPVVTILSPADESQETDGKVTIRYTVRSPNGSPVTGVRALVDGRPAEQARGLDFGAVGDAPQPLIINGGQGGTVLTMIVPIPAKDCEVTLLADNRNATSAPATVRLKGAAVASGATAGGAVAPSSVGEFVAKPKLYVLAVGIGKYADTHDIPALTFPAKDATDLAAALKAQAGGLYSSVEVRILTDTGATRDDVVKGLAWIRRQTTARDVAIVFLSGHGDNDPDGEYCFLPRNFDPMSWETTAVANSDIEKALRNIAGKALFFIDTCHSGGVDASNGIRLRGAVPDMNRMVNELSSAENGVVVFAASTGRQFALEKSEWGNGAFTKALIEGLNGKADYQHTGRITVNMLDLYISERVKELTDGRQTPTTTKPQTVPDFPVATVR